MSSEAIDIKVNKLSNKLINGLALYPALIKDNIDNGKNLKIKPADSSIKSKEIRFLLWFNFCIFFHLMTI